jgi:hypothetical protein
VSRRRDHQYFAQRQHSSVADELSPTPSSIGGRRYRASAIAGKNRTPMVELHPSGRLNRLYAPHSIVKRDASRPST